VIGAAVMVYNFVKIHKAHRLTPAMAAGITDKLWSVNDIVALVEASEPKPGKRGRTKSARPNKGEGHEFMCGPFATELPPDGLR